MVSPSTRRRISSTASQFAMIVKGGAWWGGKGLWVLTASALMVGVPWAMAFVEEQQLMEMEREQRARESTGEVRFSYPTADVRCETYGRGDDANYYTRPF